MQIEQIHTDKKRFIDLLLIADEDEKMMDKYLERGDMFALYDGDLKTVGVVTDEGNNVYELKNLATYPQYQKMGYASKLLEFITEYYKQIGGVCLMVGTGNNTPQVNFYKKCGFNESHIVRNFYTDNYPNPMYENGVQLVDMIYLKKYL